MNETRIARALSLVMTLHHLYSLEAMMPSKDQSNVWCSLLFCEVSCHFLRYNARSPDLMYFLRSILKLTEYLDRSVFDIELKFSYARKYPHNLKVVTHRCMLLPLRMLKIISQMDFLYLPRSFELDILLGFESLLFSAIRVCDSN